MTRAMRSERGHGRTRVRLAALVLAVGLVGSAGLVAPLAAAAPGQNGKLDIVAPQSFTNIDRSGELTARLHLAPSLDPASVHLLLFSGFPMRVPVDLTPRVVVDPIDGSLVTAPIGPADLTPGLSFLVAAAEGKSGKVATAVSLFSWEPDIDVSAAARCDFLGQDRCMLPFPNDYFTVADPTSDTGRRINFSPDTMPANKSAVHIDPTEWNRNDGFSPGSMILVHVPNADLAATGAAPITDIGRSLDPDAPIVLIDQHTGERHPFFAERDAVATDPADQAIILRPARNLLEGHHYIVAIRKLKDGAGNTLAPSRAFQVYRDHVPTFIPEVERRRRHMDHVLGRLKDAGVHRGNLFLAWDFTVASERNLSERMLHIRDDAFSSLDGAAPAFKVDTVDANPDPDVLRRVTGTFQVPKYLTGTGGPGSRLNYAQGAGPDALPVRNGDITANFICVVPRSVVDGDVVHPARGIVYGHGLLGSAGEVNGFGSLANRGNAVMCATNWIGMADDDIGNVLAILQDISRFPTLVDRLQQSFLNFQFLARLLKDPRGFAIDPAFQAGPAGAAVIAPGEVFFNGNSQGGILGGAATAVSTEWTRAVLGVPAINYSTLLSRSVDFDPFFELEKANYPDALDRTLLLALEQMLWDRGDSNGYAQHMTHHPYPGTPAHKVLLIEAFGDHQVANIGTEIEARTIGAYVNEPALAPGRSSDVQPFWDIPPVPTDPFNGSVLEVWDYGVPTPPTADLPPREGPDPHGAGRGEPRVGDTALRFLQPDGAFVDLCGSQPCRSDVLTGGG